jgi:hypothetical protein
MSNTTTATAQISITEFFNGKFLYTWTELSLESAIAAVKSLKISGAGKVFSLENMDGTVVEVIKM